MSPKSRSERALSIKKIFKRGPQAQTTVVTQRGISADGDVVGVRNDADRRLEDENEAVHAENRRLIADVKKLVNHRDQLKETVERLHQTVEEYQQGTDETPVSNEELDKIRHMAFLSGLRRAWNLVESAEGRPGKRQIADMLQEEIKRAKGRDDG